MALCGSRRQNNSLTRPRIPHETRGWVNAVPPARPHGALPIVMKWLCYLVVAGVVLAGCKKSGPAGGGPQGGFAVQAVVIEAKVQPVSESLSLVGTIAANEMVELKSETDGTIDDIPFKEGQNVKQGDLL